MQPWCAWPIDMVFVLSEGKSPRTTCLLLEIFWGCISGCSSWVTGSPHAAPSCRAPGAVQAKTMTLPQKARRGSWAASRCPKVNLFWRSEQNKWHMYLKASSPCILVHTDHESKKIYLHLMATGWFTCTEIHRVSMKRSSEASEWVSKVHLLELTHNHLLMHWMLFCKISLDITTEIIVFSSAGEIFMC